MLLWWIAYLVSFMCHNVHGVWSESPTSKWLMALEKNGYDKDLPPGVALTGMIPKDCHIKLLPYGNDKSRVLLQWAAEFPIILNPENIMDADLQLQRKEAAYCNGDYPGQGIFSCLIARFRLQRRVGYSLLEIYLPSTCIVVISWISFWVDPLSVPGRLGVGVTTLLALATQAVGIAYHLPAVGYAKAVDVWLGVCLMFLFGALVEFTVVNMFVRKWISVTNKSKTSLLSFPLLSMPDDNYDVMKGIIHKLRDTCSQVSGHVRDRRPRVRPAD